MTCPGTRDQEGRPILPPGAVQGIFSNVKTILGISRTIKDLLADRLADWSPDAYDASVPPCLCDAMVLVAPEVPPLCLPLLLTTPLCFCMLRRCLGDVFDGIIDYLKVLGGAG